MTSVVSITVQVEMYLNGAWVDLTASPGYVDSLSDVQWSRGVGEDRTPEPSTASFSLDNSSEVWTPGNSSSTYYNQLKRGIGVRISTTYSSTKRYHFTGVVDDVQVRITAFGPAKNRAYIRCKGLAALLAEYADYPMALQENKDLDDIMTALMTAVGSSDYSFADSSYVIPYAYPRSDAWSDLLALARSELSGLLYEDGQGRIRNKVKSSMVGGHASPTWTMGTTILPEEEIEPDYRGDSQFARVKATVSQLEWSQEFGLLYEDYTPEPLESGAARRIKGRFSVQPLWINTGYAFSAIAGYVDSLDDLYAGMSDTQTSFQSSSTVANPITFSPGMEIRIENEVILLTAAAGGSNYRQLLVGTRAQRGTTAQAHPAGAAILIRDYTLSYNVKGLTYNAMTATATTFQFNSSIGTQINTGDIIRLQNEKVFVTGKTSSGGNLFNWTFTVTRGAQGTTAAAHPANTPIELAQINPVDNIAPQSGLAIQSSDNESGQPVSYSDVVPLSSFTNGAVIAYKGRDFVFDLYNQASGTRYVVWKTVTGSWLQTKDTPVTFALEQPIPYVLGLAEGPEISLPFGVSDLNIAKGYAFGVLRAGRTPKPWLSPVFEANVSDNVGLLAAEIGDLVRYTGTGTNSEKIDDWFRIMAAGGRITPDGLVMLTFKLAPSHLFRDPEKAWYTTFSWQEAAGSVGLGAFDIAPTGSAGWTQDTQWDTYAPVGTIDPASAFTFAAASTFTNPTPGLVNMGSGVTSFRVAAQVYLGPLANNSYPVTSGGVGVVFRANSSGSQKWVAYFNPTQSKIYLWNSTDGLVTSADWTAVDGGSPEIEVAVAADRIRVYVDAAPNPVIDISGQTRFNTNTWVGPGMNRTILVGSGLQPGFRWFGATVE